jgi:hypothetical protein
MQSTRRKVRDEDEARELLTLYSDWPESFRSFCAAEDLARTYHPTVAQCLMAERLILESQRRTLEVCKHSAKAGRRCAWPSDSPSAWFVPRWRLAGQLKPSGAAFSRLNAAGVRSAMSRPRLSV